MQIINTLLQPIIKYIIKPEGTYKTVTFLVSAISLTFTFIIIPYKLEHPSFCSQDGTRKLLSYHTCGYEKNFNYVLS